MAVLPDVDQGVQIDDNQPRRMGVGSWDPSVIGRAGAMEGQALERAGTTIGAVGEDFQNSADHLQLSQALGAAHASLTTAHGQLDAITDPSQVLQKDPSTPAPAISDVNTQIGNARSMISNPRVQAEFDAQMAQPVAAYGSAAFNRGRTLNNNNAIASYQQNSDTIIGNAATLADDNAAGQALQGLKPQIQTLVTAGAVTPEQAVTMGKDATTQFGLARYRYLLGQAEQTRDYTALNKFLGSTIGGFGPAAAGAQVPGGPTGAVGEIPNAATPENLEAYKARTAQIESASGQNEGHLKSYYQFEPGTKAQYFQAGDVQGTKAGEEGPMNRLTEDNRNALKDYLGREPTGAELYLAHQQGAQGFIKMLQNPGRPAGQIVGGKEIAGNGGDPNAPASDFVALWTAKFNGSQVPSGIRTAGNRSVPNAMPAPGAPSVAAANAYLAGVKAGNDNDVQVASLGPVGLPVDQGAAAPVPGLLPSDATPETAAASAQQRAPDQAQWPTGAQSVVTNGDGTLSYQMQDGSYQPVPGSRATGAPHAPLPQVPKGSLLELMAPAMRSSIQLEGIQAVRRMQREDALANQRDTRGDLAAISDAVKTMESGVPMGDAAWAPTRAAYANSPDPHVRYNFAVADAVRNTISGFYGASPGAVAASIANMQSAYEDQINNPATAAQAGVLKQAITSSQNYLKAYQQGVAKDPIGRAAMQGIVDGVKPLDPTRSTFSQDVADRVTQAQAAAKFFGQDVPTYLRPDDKVALRKIAQAGGPNMVALANGIVAGGGTNAYQMFKEIGNVAEPLAQIGQWSLDPNMDHSDQIQRYADYVANSRDKEVARNLPHVTEQTMRSAAMADPLGDAMAEFGIGDVGRMRNTANILASESAYTQDKDPKDTTHFPASDIIPKAYQEAAGGTQNKTTGDWYGGISTVGGSYWGGRQGGYNVLVPSNMRQDKFETAIGQVNQSDIDKMGPPPMGSNGPLTAEDIKKGKFVAVPDKATGLFGGRYRVLLPDPSQGGTLQAVVNRDGKPWVFDMGRAQENGLGARVPDAFSGPWHGGGTPTGPVVPPPHRYESVKGLSPDVANADTGGEDQPVGE